MILLDIDLLVPAGLAAIDNLTLEHIRCECPVLGARKDGLIVDFNGEARAVNKSDLYYSGHNRPNGFVVYLPHVTWALGIPLVR